MFLDEISKITNLPFSEIFNEYKIVNIGGRVLHVQNFLKLLSYSKEQIILKIKKNEINIVGSDMKIAQLSSKSIYITGIVNKIFLAKEGYESDNKDQK